jgi:replicative DNA helicase
LRSLGQAVRRTGNLAAELPMPWPSLSAHRITFRRGQASLLAAAPGGGKTIFALAYAIESRVPTLFVSADTDLATMAVRAAAMVTGWSQEQVESVGLQSPQIEAALGQLAHIRWADDNQPTVEDIYLEVKAYAEVFGEFPELVVIDNLIDVQAGREIEKDWAGTRAVVDGLKRLARESEAHVLILAHATGRYEDGHDPIPLGGLEWKPGKNVELVLTMHWGQGMELRICPVKNRSGKAAADGSIHATLYAELAHCSIHDPLRGAWVLGRTPA